MLRFHHINSAGGGWHNSASIFSCMYFNLQIQNLFRSSKYSQIIQEYQLQYF